MHIHTLGRWRPQHQYGVHNARNERNTRWVVLLTIFMLNMINHER